MLDFCNFVFETYIFTLPQDSETGRPVVCDSKGRVFEGSALQFSTSFCARDRTYEIHRIYNFSKIHLRISFYTLFSHSSMPTRLIFGSICILIVPTFLQIFFVHNFF